MPIPEAKTALHRVTQPAVIHLGASGTRPPTVVAAEPTRTGAGSPGTVVGTVTLTDAGGKTFDAPGVRLTLTCEATPDAARVWASDDHGTFRFRDVLPDRCSIDADLQGSANATDGCGRSDRTGSMRDCSAPLLARARQSPVGTDRDHEG